MKIKLLYIAVAHFFLQCKYNIITLIKYRKFKKFIATWLRLKCSYLLCSAYTFSKLFLINNNSQDIYLYGETPLLTMDYIAKQANITSRDHVYEIGAGAGFTCIWLHEIIGCKVTAIEQVPKFCNILVKNCSRLTNLEVICNDFLLVDYSKASVIYLYGSNLDKNTICKLIDLLLTTKANTTIITVSWQLLSFIDSNKLFTLEKKLEVKYDWGTADVYIQKKI
jgi:SAM-dependent methyltransferase